MQVGGWDRGADAWRAPHSCTCFHACGRSLYLHVPCPPTQHEPCCAAALPCCRCLPQATSTTWPCQTCCTRLSQRAAWCCSSTTRSCSQWRPTLIMCWNRWPGGASSPAQSTQVGRGSSTPATASCEIGSASLQSRLPLLTGRPHPPTHSTLLQSWRSLSTCCTAPSPTACT